MRIVFRTDASLQIGSGHVMRCLTLADALRTQGAECYFISRTHPGHMVDLIRKRGYETFILSIADDYQLESPADQSINNYLSKKGPAHSAWLGHTWQADAKETLPILIKLKPNWLIVDHYSLDKRWEEALKIYYHRLMVIDDLADRPHRCDLLLDQNLGRQARDYMRLVPEHCRLLIGPHFSLLRPEFAEFRPYSLQRRDNQKKFRQVLISMGGVDEPNATGQILSTLKTCDLPRESCLTIVMGLNAPWLENVRKLAAEMPWPTQVVVNINDMARRMAEADLAFGAAGGTSWERCCLGLPTLTIVLAENQHSGAMALDSLEAACLIGRVSDIAKKLPVIMTRLMNTDLQSRMSLAARDICTGEGVGKVLRAIGTINASA